MKFFPQYDILSKKQILSNLQKNSWFHYHCVNISSQTYNKRVQCLWYLNQKTIINIQFTSNKTSSPFSLQSNWFKHIFNITSPLFQVNFTKAKLSIMEIASLKSEGGGGTVMGDSHIKKNLTCTESRQKYRKAPSPLTPNIFLVLPLLCPWISDLF